ncbi:hypothetical protein AAV35_011400 [Salimicrobium jeotgali]|uniref:NERD domain-containing protein n=1 Tax=Salimicrobium jeotgali TaxID=1230341 RepID=K2FJT9_9BACI|nr:hypothetical protein [Salimicrobium jeotgali]AKG05321.1 hypothetical protein AAV35_011400 [Salimicrobium jeotgali]EKE31326.1 hypothetical protein MJ3_08821 [Salimicrobium jeotgali]MBM7696935.1 hypothetical protein [Salimicrobium jeotgali]
MSLEQLYKKYDSQSLAKALYAITSWVSNRRYLAIVDKLNRTFLDLEDTDNYYQSIKSYREFQDFYEELSVFFSTTDKMMVEDFPIDTGEIKYFSNDRFYKVLLGNGSENTYETCFLIDSIINSINEEKVKNIWKEILNYEDYILSIIYKGDHNTNDKFECPPEKYFKNIFDNFASFNNQILSSYFDKFVSVNDELYRFYTKEGELPVFLPMMKECFLEKLINDYSSNEIKFGVWSKLINSIRENFLVDRKETITIMYPVILEHKVLDYSFAIFDKGNAIIFISNAYDFDTKYYLEGLYSGSVKLGGLFSNVGDNIYVDTNEGKNISFQQIDDDHLNPNATYYSSIEADESIIDAKGLVGIFNFSSSIEEIISFLNYYRNPQQNDVFNASGMTGFFQIWKDMDNVVDEGALDPTIFIPPYQSVHKTFELFKNELVSYPFEYPFSFSSVHSWDIKKESKSDLTLVGKEHSGEVNLFESEKKKLALYETHFMIEDITEEIVETIYSFQEIIINELNEYKDKILTQYDENFLELKLVSERILKQNALHNSIVETEYFKKLIIKFRDKPSIVLVNPYWNKIAENNIKSTTKKFENELLISLMEGLSFGDSISLFSEIRKNDNEKRTSKISKVEVPYYIKPHSYFSSPNNAAFKSVRKTMAETLKKIGLEPNDYEENEILGVIRQFRNEIRDELLINLSNFDRLQTHKKLLDQYSSVLFQIDIHQKRISSFAADNYLKDIAIKEFKERTISMREEAKTYKFILEYTMEENLSLLDRKNNYIASSEDIEELVAFSKWIVDFQSMSDAVNYGAVGWNKLSIREDYVIEIEETEKYLSDAHNIRRLRYDYGDYSMRDDSIDEIFFKKIENNFKIDTGLSFKLVISLMYFLESHQLISELIENEEARNHNNIVETPTNILAREFVNLGVYSLEDFYSALSFISLNPNELIDKSGIIPIWEKKKRKCKMLAQPILHVGDKVLYSPVSIYELRKSWVQGIMNFIIPYDIGMENTVALMNQWKREYESKIVRDLAALFNHSKYIVYIDQELYKLDKKGNHPRNLGDYDLIVIDGLSQKVFLFEVKYMRLSQTMKDSMGDQNEYFTGKKAKAKKFSRRAEYFEENKNIILQNLGLKGYYDVQSYFVSNKNIRSFFRDYPFNILSFNEIKANLESQVFNE